jgi:UDP-N-acetylglucosamine 2-epimerase (non-hydrolysing)
MLIHIVGARPNFMKLAPLYRECKKNNLSQKIVHTGQHYDKNMSDVFFEKFDIPAPEYNLNIHNGSHSWQTANMMIAIEEVLLKEKPKVVVVFGDVNSTMAAALVCSKLMIPIVHVEAGLRSGDNTMPEEINRRVTDTLANVLYTPSADADQNLLNEGVKPERIELVGNIMIDILMQSLPYIDDSLLSKYPAKFGILTLHRPSNVDYPERLKEIIESIVRISLDIPLVFPVHPRKKNEIELLISQYPKHNIIVEEPVDYFSMLCLEKNAVLAITDSGGLQEETTYLGVPCLVLRENTERPVTVSMGTGELIGFNYDKLEKFVSIILNNKYKKGKVPELWDGKTSERIVKSLIKRFSA